MERVSIMDVAKKKSEDRLSMFGTTTTTTLFVFLLTIPIVEGEVHYRDFILTDKNFTRSCVARSMLVVNEQFPGPTLYVRKGDTVFVNVQNYGNSEVTIHWHGVNQPGNPWSDGPEYITQCPIQPGMNFTYEVIFSVEEGTLWWHAHNEWTRNTVHGAIVVYPIEGSTTPYPEPFGEQVLILGSWYNYDVNLVVEEDLKAGVFDMPEANHGLINGLPGDITGCSQEDTFRWEVEHNKTYLLRIVNAAMNAELFFSIARHNVTVVGTDGGYLKPFESSYIMISPGQTIDVLVTTNQPSSSGKYYMAARELRSALNSTQVMNLMNATAVLGYKNTIDGNTHLTDEINLSSKGLYSSAKYLTDEDEDEDEDGVVFPDTLPSNVDLPAAYHFIGRFKSLANEAYPIDVPTNITTRMFIVVTTGVLQMDNGTNGFDAGASLNNISWTNTKIDILQAYYRNMSGVFSDDFPDEPSTYYNYTSNDTQVAMRGTKVKMLNYNEQVEVVFQGTDVMNTAMDHPMHLHGHIVYRVGFGAGTFDPVLDPMSYNLIDPPAGNTFTVPADGWIAVRFTANNPGVWLWHCHLDKHLSWGMNTVFITRNGGTPESTMRDPPSNMPSCNSSLVFGGRTQIENSF